MPETMTEFIKRDLAARVRNEGDLPGKLTLTALARHYKVSLTPVRLAVQELIDEQVLRKFDNGRLGAMDNGQWTMDNGGTGPASAVPLPFPADEAVDIEKALSAEILAMSLRGEGDYLREEATAERHGIGRTVLRQVLMRLAGRGLIEHLPRRGWRVRLYDEAEMISYLQVRESLELRALDLARPHLDPLELKRMLHGNRPRKGQTERLDNNLHAYLIERCGNRYIQDFFERHGLYYSTLFDYAAPEANVVARMARQHRKILRALFSKDWKTARKSLAHHIRAQRPILERLLRKIRVGT